MEFIFDTYENYLEWRKSRTGLTEKQKAVEFDQMVEQQLWENRQPIGLKPEDSPHYVEGFNYDFINPNHYKKGNKEVWEMMVDIWGVEAFITHCEMNAYKYMQRLGSKPNAPIEQDLKKASWYLNKAQELKELNNKEEIK